jgi:Ca2+-transporting ATPase
MRLQEPPATPLQQRLARFARLIGIAVAIAAVLAFAIGVARGESGAFMFRVAVALAVAAVPEGLPVAFTITLALGVRRMARRNAIVRRLSAVETLGSTSTVGSEKTGSLTENRMTVKEIWTADGFHPLGPAGDDGSSVAAAPSLPEALGLTLLAGVLASEAELFVTDQGLEGQGDPTEVALLVAAARLGVEHEEARACYRP